MTEQEALGKIAAGWILIIAEVRGVSVACAGYVCKKTGLAALSVIATYFVECNGSRGFEILKITQRAPKGINEPDEFKTGVEKGKRYVFEIEGLERKPGFLTARMGAALPEPIEAPEGAAAAPQAQALRA